MKKENDIDSMTLSKGQKEQKMINELEHPKPRKIPLENFNDTLTNLRFKYGYNYEQAQRYFKRVHGMDKDEFEMMSAEADSLSD